MALQPPHQGGQAPLFALPQTLATSPIVYFPNSALIDEKVNHQTTSASLFVPLSSGLESDGEDKILDPAYDRGDTFLEDGVADTSGPDLRNLFDLWVTAKARAATLSSLIFGLYQRSPSESIKPPVFTSPDEEIGHAAASQGSVDSWLSRKACGWIGLCNMAQNRNGPGDFVNRLAQGKAPWKGEKHQPGDWDGDGRVLGEIPSYVLEHAPYVHLFSNEQFWPCDMAVHLKHITPELNYTPIQASSEHPTLSNLDELNQWKQGLNVFLTSNDNVETDPDWLEGRVNIPQPIGPDGRPSQTKRWTGEDSDVFDDTGDSWLQKDDEFESQVDDGNLANRLKDHHSTNQRPKQGGKSEAPAVLIVVDKGQGIVDAFWFYFYSFNLGNGVFNIRFGSHVGDWEHTLVRFENGKPLTVFCSEHSFGEAFTYDAAEKIGKRVGHQISFLTHDRFQYVCGNFDSFSSFYSLSFTLPLVHTPCTPLLVYMTTFSPLDFSMTKLTAAHSGTLSGTPNPTHMTTQTTLSSPLALTPLLQHRGSTLPANGATKYTP